MVVFNKLPCLAINLVNETLKNARINSSAKRLTHLFLIRARILCHILFISTLMEFRVMPVFVENIFNHVPFQDLHNNAIKRKLFSLKLEILRTSKKDKQLRLREVERELGYEYLNVMRSAGSDFRCEFLRIIIEMVQKEEDLMFNTHSRKWKKLTDWDYPLSCESYVFSHKPYFHYYLKDNWWPDRNSFTIESDSKHNVDKCNAHQNNRHVTNDSSHDIPTNVIDLLEKGPKFRVPTMLNCNLIKETETQLDRLTYKMRYNEVLQQNNADDDTNKIIIPFSKNTVKLPEKMNKYEESCLFAFKREVIEIMKDEIRRNKNNSNYRQIQNDIKDTREFLKSNNLVAVKSDKTNRLVVTDINNHLNKSRELLHNTENYKTLDNSKFKRIETQANRLIKNICKDKLDKSDCQRLITMGSKPANFTTLIKDHKVQTNSWYPLRPVASTINTPTNKIDWLVSRILNQLLIFIPSYLKNTEQLLLKMKNISMESITRDNLFISLDVINLYPSIPISEAIHAVINFAEKWWSHINNFGFSLDELKKCLSFISYNYEIQFENRSFLQIKGCPMGAHFSPPFAIIFMHEVEETALAKLYSETGYKPTVYARYIDDIIMGPLEKDTTIINEILEIFNSINDNIKFTIEIPEYGKPINFLDISLETVDQGITYTWFRKPTHSNLLLHQESNVPFHMKRNFVLNTYNRIEARCSEDKEKMKKIKEFESILEENKYSKKQIISFKTQHAKKDKKIRKVKKKKTSLFINYISDNTNRKINKTIDKYGLNIKLVCKPAPQLSTILKNKKETHIEHKNNCVICKVITNNKCCQTRYVVYQFSCKLCQDEYIGQTARPFHFRFKEHKRSIEHKNGVSALSEHIENSHTGNNLTINDFNINFLEIFDNPVDCKISEAKYISLKHPRINRRNELPQW